VTLLSVEGLEVRIDTDRGVLHAVNGVDLTVEAGEIVGLVGESGCGKSVTSLAILRLLPEPAARVTRGRVMLDGVDLLQLPVEEMRKVRGPKISMVFQDPGTSLNPVLTIEEQLTETLSAHSTIDRKQARERAIELLGMVGISSPRTRLRSYPHEFSGGMRQRVMIAIALALEPKLLIADEPTTALDVTIQAQVLELVAELVSRTKTAVILITHDLGIAARMTQRLNVMYGGLIVESGSTSDLFYHPHHPYTVGLLQSLPRIDRPSGADLLAIEGVPPQLIGEFKGCPFTPRCAWRLPRCLEETPALLPVDGPHDSENGAARMHLAACHNQPTDEDARAGRPLRPAGAAPTADERPD
jgi:oligopeptide/dipeptide ABC transporter ATP-binding protein